MFGMGFGELLLIVLVLFFFFGAKRLPEIARGLGGGIKSFKAEMRGEGQTPPVEPGPQAPLLPPEPGRPQAPLPPPDDPNAPRG